MVRRNLALLCALGAVVCGATAGAQGQRLAPPPPGTVTQNIGAYLAGDAMNSRYQVVASRKTVGTADEVQWYLSVYGPSAKGQSLVFQSPGSDASGLVPKLERGYNTKRFFPHETLKIIGKGELMGEGRDQAVVLVTAASADCGGVTVAVLDADGGTVKVAAKVENPCNLSAKIVNHTIVLTGAYYNKSAPMCCPTKPNATAVLRYTGGRWVEKPQYFKLTASSASAVTPLTHATPMFTPIFKSVVTTPAPSGPPQPPH